MKNACESGPIRVLIADDDSDQVMLMRDALSMEEDIICCEHAQDGYEALKAIREQEPDVLLLDLFMPGMDGVDMLREMHRNPPPKIPHVLILSACNDKMLSTEAISLGAEHVLMKPYSLDLLISNIRSAQASTAEIADFTMEQLVPRMLLCMETPIKRIGFDYIEYVILRLIERGGISGVYKNIYHEIAMDKGVSVDSIEKAIRSTIGEIFRADSDMLHVLLAFGNLRDKKRLTNGQFLTLAAQGIVQKDIQRRVIFQCQTV